MPASIISLGGDALDFGAIEFGPGNPLRVAVAGAHGRMGSEVVKAVDDASDMVVVCEIERGEDIALALQISRAQVMVDFTVPKAVRGNMLAALEVGVVPIIGTSGINEAMMEEVRRACFHGRGRRSGRAQLRARRGADDAVRPRCRSVFPGRGNCRDASREEDRLAVGHGAC